MGGIMAATTGHSTIAFPATPASAVMIPMPSTRWEDAKAIGPPAWRRPREQMDRVPISATGFSSLNDTLAGWKSVGPQQKPIYADFCEVRDRSGRWHLVGIEVDPSISGYPTFYHYVSDRLTGNYVRLPSISGGPAAPNPPGQILKMCAPCVVWKDPETALMFYGHVIDRISATGQEETFDASIRVLESVDARLEKWVPRSDPELEEGNILFHEKFSRDPEIIWDDRRKLYLMYYAVGDGWSDPEDRCVLKIRTSPDLRKWSEPKTLMAPPPGYRACESPCVLKRDGLYYLWVSGFDWGRMSLYISEDPLDFGDPVGNRIMEQSGHTPEIAYWDGEFWMACAGIATKFGFPWGLHDLIGTYIQPLKWREANGAELEKVVRQQVLKSS